MADFSQKRSNYLKIMLGDTGKGISKVSPDAINDLNNNLFDAAELESHVPIVPMQAPKLLEEPEKDDRNWWQHFTDWGSSFRASINKGLLNFVDSIGDFFIGTAGVIGSWFGADTEWAENAIKYDWTSTAERVANAMSGLDIYGRMFNADYWTTESWTPNASGGTAADYNASRFHDDKFSNFIAGMGEFTGEVLPSLVLGALTGGASIGVQVGLQSAVAGTKAFGSSVESALNEGGDFMKAAGYGAIHGTIGAALAGATAGLGASITGASGQTIAKTASQAVGNVIGQKTGSKALEVLAGKTTEILIKSLGDAGVAAIRTGLDPAFKQLTYDQNAWENAYGSSEATTQTFKNIGKAALIAGLSSAVMSVGREVGSLATSGKEGYTQQYYDEKQYAQFQKTLTSEQRKTLNKATNDYRDIEKTQQKAMDYVQKAKNSYDENGMPTKQTEIYEANANMYLDKAEQMAITYAKTHGKVITSIIDDINASLGYTKAHTLTLEGFERKTSSVDIANQMGKVNTAARIAGLTQLNRFVNNGGSIYGSEYKDDITITSEGENKPLNVTIKTPDGNVTGKINILSSGNTILELPNLKTFKFLFSLQLFSQKKNDNTNPPDFVSYKSRGKTLLINMNEASKQRSSIMLADYEKQYETTPDENNNYKQIVALPDGRIGILHLTKTEDGIIVGEGKILKPNEVEKEYGEQWENIVENNREKGYDVKVEGVGKNEKLDIRRIRSTNTDGIREILRLELHREGVGRNLLPRYKRVLQEQDTNTGRIGGFDLVVDKNSQKVWIANDKEGFKRIVSDTHNLLPIAQQVAVDTPEQEADIQNARFLLNSLDGKQTIMVAEDGEIKAVINADKNVKGWAKIAIPQAIHNGGIKLNCNDNGANNSTDNNTPNLIYTYSKYGFIPVSRIKWNKDTMQGFHGEEKTNAFIKDYGEHDVVVMVFSGKIEPQFANIEEARAAINKTPVFSGENDFEKAVSFGDKWLKEHNITPENPFNATKTSEPSKSTPQPETTLETPLNQQETANTAEPFTQSKIIDENGNLLVVYHGTNQAGIEEFNSNIKKSQTGTNFGDNQVNFFTTSKENAKSYGGNTYAVNLDITNPLTIDVKGSSFLEIKRFGGQKIRLAELKKFYDKYVGKKMGYKLKSNSDRVNEFKSDLLKIGYELELNKTTKAFDLYSASGGKANAAPIGYSFTTIQEVIEDGFNEGKDLRPIKENLSPFETINDIVRETLANHPEYDGIIFNNVRDSKDVGAEPTTTIVTLKSSKQIKIVEKPQPQPVLTQAQEEALKVAETAEAVEQAQKVIEPEPVIPDTITTPDIKPQGSGTGDNGNQTGKSSIVQRTDIPASLIKDSANLRREKVYSLTDVEEMVDTLLAHIAQKIGIDKIVKSNEVKDLQRQLFNAMNIGTDADFVDILKTLLNKVFFDDTKTRTDIDLVGLDNDILTQALNEVLKLFATNAGKVSIMRQTIDAFQEKVNLWAKKYHDLVEYNRQTIRVEKVSNALLNKFNKLKMPQTYGGQIKAPAIDIFKQFTQILGNSRTVNGSLSPTKLAKGIEQLDKNYTFDNLDGTAIPFNQNLRDLIDNLKSATLKPNAKVPIDVLKDVLAVVYELAATLKHVNQEYLDEMSVSIRSSYNNARVVDNFPQNATRKIADFAFDKTALVRGASSNLRILLGENSPLVKLMEGEYFNYLGKQKLVSERFATQLNDLQKENNIKSSQWVAKRKITLQGKTFEMNNKELFELYKNYLAPENLAQMLKSGIVIGKNKFSGLTKDDIKNITDLLPTNIKNYAEQVIKDFYNGTASEYENEKSIEYTGQSFEFIDKTTEDGEPNYYYPKNIGEGAYRGADLDSKSPRINIKPTFSHHKLRVNHDKPIVITDGIANDNRHINGMAQEELRPFADKLNAVLNYQVVGDDGHKTSTYVILNRNYKSIKPTLDNYVAGVMEIDQAPLPKMLAKGLGMAYTGALGFNPSPILKQFSSAIKYIARYGMANFLKAIPLGFRNLLNYGKVRQALAQQHGGFNARFFGSQSVYHASLSKDLTNKISGFFGKGMEFTDSLVVVAGFGMAQLEVERVTGFKVGTPENDALAAELHFMNTIATQSNAVLADYSRIRTGSSGGTLVKHTFGVFGADSQKNAEIISEALLTPAFANMRIQASEKQIKKEQAAIEDIDEKLNNDNLNDKERKEHEERKQQKEADVEDLEENVKKDKETYSKKNNAKRIGLALVAVLIAGLTSAAASELVARLYGRKDWDEFDMVQYLKDGLYEATLGSMPIIKTITDAFVSNYDIQAFPLSVIQDLIDATKLVQTATESGNSEDLRRAIFAFASIVGNALGIPVKNLTNVIMGAWKNFEPNSGATADYWLRGTKATAIQSHYNEQVAKGNLTKAVADLDVLMSFYKTGSANRSLLLELAKLSQEGETVLPRNSMTYMTLQDDTRVDLTENERYIFQELYKQANNAATTLISDPKYLRMQASERARVMRRLFDAYYAASQSRVTKEMPSSKLARLLFITGGNIELAQHLLLLQELQNIVDTNTKTKKENSLDLINKNRSLSKTEKMLVAYLNGYSLTEANQNQVMRYLMSKGANGTLAKEFFN